MSKKLFDIKLGNMPFIIAFSGSCYSGKTSTMNALKSILEHEGYKVIVLKELIRDSAVAKSGESIDKIRQNVDTYFVLQKDIIQQKLSQERDAFNSNKPIIYLIDRAITDSLFYYEFYVDKSQMSHETKKEYFRFHKWLCEQAKLHINLYDMLIEFTPLHGCDRDDDKMRPLNLELAVSSEYECIDRLNNAYLKEDNGRTHYFMHVNLNYSFSNDVQSQIIERIQALCKAQKR